MTPDFDQIARKLTDQANAITPLTKGMIYFDIKDALREAWNAGFEAGGQYEIFVKHLKDENNAAHLALDRLDAPKTRRVPRHNFDGGTQEITIGLAERINAALEQWKANSRENKLIAEGLGHERDELLAALKEYVEWFGAVHGEQCPADDTCTCIGGGLNARVSAAIAKAEGR